ncbi:hypothetical protein ACVGVM_08905 [Pseudonocardia bannensis]|uniref:Uncharacterized protein n=1 Tax=Pseudonocardia bannensis TaxID=630973 RepID=A0A848DI64_9PSEU|nr:hypothetical protein [Pseudonocardia bannensis]NMH92245.1 hypothetical protein [Pseudonocardia bannensis]
MADEDLHSLLVELATDMIEHGERHRADLSSLQEGLLETVDARVLDLLDAPQRRPTPPGRR